MKTYIYQRYGAAEQLEWAEIAKPEPKSGELLVRVLSCAVNLSDWEYLTGHPLYARLVGGVFRPKRPVLGSDIVGIVEQIGAGAHGFSIGDRVMGDFVMTRGGFAPYAALPADHAAKVPDGLRDDIAACLPQAGGIALSGTAQVRRGTRLLINGAGGGSGTMALQLAKAAGAVVTAVDNGGKTDWLLGLGADQVIDYTKEDFAATGQKWDVILDMVATRGPKAIAAALAPKGQYRAVGGGVPTLLALLIGGLAYRMSGKSIGMLMVPAGRKLTQEVAQAALDGRLSPHLEATLPLSEMPEALARTGRGAVRGKIVIKPERG